MDPRAITSVATRIVVGACSGVFPSGEGRVAFSFGVFTIIIALFIGVAITIAIDVVAPSLSLPVLRVEVVRLLMLLLLRRLLLL